MNGVSEHPGLQLSLGPLQAAAKRQHMAEHVCQASPMKGTACPLGISSRHCWGQAKPPKGREWGLPWDQQGIGPHWK